MTHIRTCCYRKMIIFRVVMISSPHNAITQHFTLSTGHTKVYTYLLSDPASVNLDIPQGSIIGQQLFSIFILLTPPLLVCGPHSHTFIFSLILLLSHTFCITVTLTWTISRSLSFSLSVTSLLFDLLVWQTAAHLYCQTLRHCKEEKDLHHQLLLDCHIPVHILALDSPFCVIYVILRSVFIRREP